MGQWPEPVCLFDVLVNAAGSCTQKFDVWTRNKCSRWLTQVEKGESQAPPAAVYLTEGLQRLAHGDLGGFAQICRDHFRVAANLCCGALDELSAIVEHQNPIGDIHHHLHVVLD